MKELDTLNSQFVNIVAVSSLLSVTDSNPGSFLNSLTQVTESFIGKFLKSNHPKIHSKLSQISKQGLNVDKLFKNVLSKDNRASMGEFLDNFKHILDRQATVLSKTLSSFEPQARTQPKGMARNDSIKFKLETGSKSLQKELPRSKTQSQLLRNDSFGTGKPITKSKSKSKLPQMLESSDEESGFNPNFGSNLLAKENSLFGTINPENRSVFNTNQDQIPELRSSVSSNNIHQAKGLSRSKSQPRMPSSKPKVPSLNFNFRKSQALGWSQIDPRQLRDILKLKIQKMYLADQKELSRGMTSLCTMKSFGMIKDNYYYYLGTGQKKLGVVNHNEKTKKWKLCHMAFIPNCKLVKFCKEKKYFLCAVTSEISPSSPVCDIRCFKDGKSYCINFGSLQDHLRTKGVNLELGFRNSFNMTIFASLDNLMVLMFDLDHKGVYNKIIKLSNKFIKYSIADVKILTRSSFVVLGTKGYVGLYRKRATVNQLKLQGDTFQDLAPSSFLEEESFTFKIESQLDIKMTDQCRSLCMDVTLDQNFITIVVYSAKKKSYLLLIVKIKNSKSLVYLTHQNLNIESSEDREFRVNSRKRIGGVDIITIFTNDKVMYFGIKEGKIVNIGERSADFGKLYAVRNITGDKMVAVNEKFEMFTLAYHSK